MVTITFIWTRIVLEGVYFCVMEEMRGQDEKRKQKCSQWKHWCASLHLYISKFGLMAEFMII